MVNDRKVLFYMKRVSVSGYRNLTVRIHLHLIVPIALGLICHCFQSPLIIISGNF